MNVLSINYYLHVIVIVCTCIMYNTIGKYAVMPEPGGPGGPLALPIFVRSVNPIRTGEARLSPPITTGTPKFFTFRHHWYVLHFSTLA